MTNQIPSTLLLLMALLHFSFPATAFLSPTPPSIHQSSCTVLHSSTSNSKPKKKREKNFRKLSAANDLMTSHKERLQTAGKAGTLRYADPTLLFVGNLNFTATEDQLRQLVIPLVSASWDIAKVQIVRDWKSGDSKGYGFVRFTEPVYAALCIAELNSKEFLGRRLLVKAAQSKADSPLRKQQREEQKRLKAIRRAQNPPPPPPPPKNENAEFLAYLDEDLAAGVDFDDDDDGDDGDYDGVFVPGSAPPKGFG